MTTPRCSRRCECGTCLIDFDDFPVVISSFSVAIAANADDYQANPPLSGLFTGPTNDKIGNEVSGFFVYQYGLRFINVTIPIGATILSATIDFYCSVTQTTGNCKIKYSGVAADNPVAPTTYAAHAAHTLTAANVLQTMPSWNGGTIYTSPELAPIVQELMDRGGRASGDSLIIRLDDNGSSNANYRQFRTHDNTTPYPTLNITYSI